MTNLVSFQFENSEIHAEVRCAVAEDGKPRFPANDVSSALGYTRTSDGLVHCRKCAVLPHLNKINNLHPATKWIPESDVYRMVMRSNLPAAEAFQDWVVEEVLPTIREKGSYHTTGQTMPDFTNPAEAARAWADAYEAKLRLEQDNQLLNTIIDNEFGYCSILRAAQHLGVSETVFNWRPLKKRTLEMGAEVKKVPSPRYAYQNLYPISAFEFCYPEYDFTGLQPEAVATRATKLLTGQTGMTAH